MSEPSVREVFDHFDKNRNGKIEASEVKAALAELGTNLSDQEAADLLRGADLNQDGVVTFDEFEKLFQGLTA